MKFCFILSNKVGPAFISQKVLIYRARLHYYLAEHATSAAQGFVDALEEAYAHISRFPAAGSNRYAYELDLPGLRCWSLKSYPWMVFYVEEDASIDVWRVLHGMRDIPASLGFAD